MPAFLPIASGLENVLYYWLPVTDTGTGTTTTTMVNVWSQWNQGFCTTGNNIAMMPAYGAEQAQALAAYGAEQAQALESEFARRQLALERTQSAAAATAKADNLLKAMLNKEQRTQYEREQTFEVRSQGSRRRYQLTHGWAGNVFLLDERGRRIEKLCIHPVIEMPVADNLIAQKLLLEADEETFRRTANITRLVA